MRKMRPNEFLARPRDFRGGVTMGVQQFPGFHTAENEETTYAYAQQKVAPETVGRVAPEDVADYLIDDYPVVIELDMSGLPRLTDYDAEHFVRPKLLQLGQHIASEAARSDQSLAEILEEHVEFGEDQRDWMPSTAVEYLYHYGASVTEEPSAALLKVADDSGQPEEFLRRLADGQLSKNDLASITGQYRYLVDVPTGRISAVYYLKPWWPDVLDIESGFEDEELFRAVQQAGWNVIDVEDVLSNSLEVMGTKVYGEPVMRGGRPEYHGTTYHNLVAAAPELELPVPPLPYEPEEG